MRAKSPAFLVSLLCLSLPFLVTACAADDGAAGAPGGPNAPSGSSGSSGTSGGGAEAKPACTPGDDAFETTAPWVPAGSPGSRQLASWTLDGVVEAAGVLSVLAHRKMTEHVELAFIDTKGEVTSLAKLPDAFSLNAAPFADGAKRCAVFTFSSGKSLRVACDDGTAEDSGVRADGSKALIPVLMPDGTLSVFTQSFASYTEVRREGGKWREEEKYESSVSWPEDVSVHDGQPVTCFISQGGRAVVEGAAGRAASTEEAKRCRVAAGPSGVHVLTNEGYAAVPWSDLGARRATYATSPVAIEGRVERLVLADGQPFAVVIDAEKKQALRVALPSGKSDLLAELADSVSVQTSFDGTTGALRIVTARTETTSPTAPAVQRFRIARRCAGSWTP